MGWGRFGLRDLPTSVDRVVGLGCGVMRWHGGGRGGDTAVASIVFFHRTFQEERYGSTRSYGKKREEGKGKT